MIKKIYGRLYYRRYAAKEITGLVCLIDPTVDKAGATFDTEGAVDQLFVGMTIIIDALTYRVASITSNIQFELSSTHDADETKTGYITTPQLADMLASALVTELATYWTEFAFVEIGALMKIEKADSQMFSTGSIPVISEKALIEMNVLGFQQSSAVIEGRFAQLRTAIHQKPCDIIFYSDNLGNPFAVQYSNIVGAVSLETPAGALPKILITADEEKGTFDENNYDLLKFTVETPVATPGAQAGPVDVTVTCATITARMYYTTNGDTPDEDDTLIANGEILSCDDFTLKVKAFREGMTDSAMLTEIYT